MAKDNIFPMYPQAASRTVAALTDTTAVELVPDAMELTVNSATDVAGVFSLSEDLPAGLVFKVKAGVIAGAASVTVNGADGSSTFTLSSTGASKTIMILEAGAFVELPF